MENNLIELKKYTPFFCKIVRFDEADVIRVSYGDDGNTDSGWIDEDASAGGF